MQRENKNHVLTINQFEMKKLSLGVLLCATMSLTAQVTTIFEFESNDYDTLHEVLDIWAPTMEKGIDQELPPTYVFVEQGTRTYYLSQEFGSLSQWANYQENMEAKDEAIGKAFQESAMTPEMMQNFNQGTDAHELSLWTFMPELSTVDSFMEMSVEERDALPYRRIVYIKTDMNQQGAFENFIKEQHKIDDRLGVDHIFAVYRAQAGSRDANYLMAIVDKSRFEYTKNWENRMKIRKTDQTYNDMQDKRGGNPWKIVEEKHLMRINELTY